MEISKKKFGKIDLKCLAWRTTGQIRGAGGSRPFKLVNEIMSLTKVGIYALGVTKIH